MGISFSLKLKAKLNSSVPKEVIEFQRRLLGNDNGVCVAEISQDGAEDH